MEMLLVGVTLVSLVLATSLAAVAWKLMRDHRRFAAARVDALVALAAADEPRDAVAPGMPLFEASLDDFDLNRAPMAIDAPATAMFATAPAPGARRRLSLALGMVAVVVAAGAGTAWAVHTSGATFLSTVLRAASISETAASVRPLELRSLTHELDDTGHFVVAGLVADPAGGRTFEDVVVVVYLFDERGQCFANSRAAIASTTLRAGDESRFEVRVPATAPVSRYRIGFRLPDGDTVAHVDKRATQRAETER
jgi:hypothetical protein